jgi:hypothetical protein
MSSSLRYKIPLPWQLLTPDGIKIQGPRGHDPVVAPAGELIAARHQPLLTCATADTVKDPQPLGLFEVIHTVGAKPHAAGVKLPDRLRAKRRMLEFRDIV